MIFCMFSDLIAEFPKILAKFGASKLASNSNQLFTSISSSLMGNRCRQAAFGNNKVLPFSNFKCGKRFGKTESLSGNLGLH